MIYMQRGVLENKGAGNDTPSCGNMPPHTLDTAAARLGMMNDGFMRQVDENEHSSSRSPLRTEQGLGDVMRHLPRACMFAIGDVHVSPSGAVTC
jgi:hypothetical protein